MTPEWQLFFRLPIVFEELRMRSKIRSKLWRTLACLVVIICVGVGTWFSRGYWLPLFADRTGPLATKQDDGPQIAEPKVLKLSPQARANLGLESKPALIQTYWRKIQIPGVIVDRPGVTDRGITSPIAGVITQVHAFEGDIVQPGEKLFTLRLVSEYLQQTQADLFKAIRETEIFNKEMVRLNDLAVTGIIPGKRILELEQQISRQSALIDSFRQELTSRGLQKTQIDQIEQGTFIATIDVHAPEIAKATKDMQLVEDAITTGPASSDFFQIQELKVHLGQQLDAGELLAILANHSSLYVKGLAFKMEASDLARAAEQEWEVDVEFTEDSGEGWPELAQEFRIRHLANTTDPNSRTFDFFIPLVNQSRVYEKDDRPLAIWRFRPGQRVRIQVPVEEIQNVIVLPAAAVIQEGPEAWVFQQNGDLFNRITVQVVHQDRTSIVIANDGSITPGFYLAQGSAATLNRVLKAQAASGMRADVHVHADGSTHAAH